MTGVLEWQEKQAELYVMYNNNNYCHYSHNFATDECVPQRSDNPVFSKSVGKPVKFYANDHCRRIITKHKTSSATVGDVTTSSDSNPTSTTNGYEILDLAKPAKTVPANSAAKDKVENVKRKKL